MKLLSDRLEWLANRAGGFRGLDRAAGFPEGNMNQAWTRAKAKEKGEVSRGEFGITVAAALARATGVRLEWLATGEDGPFAASELAHEPDSPASRACSAAVALGYPPAAIEAGIAAAENETDPWEILGQIRAESRRPTPARSPYGLPLTTTHRPVGSTDVEPPKQAPATPASAVAKIKKGAG